MKNHSDETFVAKFRLIKFRDYSNHTCVNDTFQDFVTKFSSAVDFVLSITILRMKSNCKPWFDVLNAIRNRDKLHKKFKQSGKEAGKDNFKYVKLSLEKIINNKKNFILVKKLLKIKTIPKNSGEF